jgi:hypothetical protein
LFLTKQNLSVKIDSAASSGSHGNNNISWPLFEAGPSISKGIALVELILVVQEGGSWPYFSKEAFHNSSP